MVSENKKLPISDILQKIIPANITKELSKITPKSETKNILKCSSLVGNEYIKKKIIPEKKNVREETKQDEIKTIGSLLNSDQRKKTSIHSEKHYLVDEIRNYFGEKAVKGVGSFSFYLGFFKRIPEKKIYEFWSETKQSKKSIADQQKLFWWKVGQYMKNK